MNRVAIDIIGTIQELIFRALKQILLLLGIILFGLLAPPLLTLGPEILVWQNPTGMSWGAAYFLLGPFACAIWMAFICHWHSVRRWQRAGKLSAWREDQGDLCSTKGKSIWFMVSGFFSYAIAERVFLVAADQIFPQELTRESMMTYFALAPLFAFAPPLVLLSRWIRRAEYLTAFSSAALPWNTENDLDGPRRRTAKAP